MQDDKSLEGCGTSQLTRGRCTRRRHIDSAYLRKKCAEGPLKSMNFVCTNCGKELVGCRECARNERIVQWAYRDAHHLTKDHSKKRGCGRNGSRKAPRMSSRYQLETVPSPRLSIVHRLSVTLAQRAAQLVPGFIPSLHVGNMNLMGGALDELACMYNGANGAPIPKGVSRGALGKYIGDGIACRFIEKLNESGFALKEGKSISIFKSGEGNGVNYTSTHSDNHTVVIIVLSGQKNVWLGGREVSTGPFLDSAGREWVPLSNKDDSTTSHFWDLAENSDAGEHDMEEDTRNLFARKMQAFRRATIGPGDALLIPRRYLHTLTTAPSTTSISAIVREKN